MRALHLRVVSFVLPTMAAAFSTSLPHHRPGTQVRKSQGWKMAPRNCGSARRALFFDDVGSDFGSSETETLIGGDSSCCLPMEQSIASTASLYQDLRAREQQLRKESAISTASFYDDLRARQEQLKHGIGRRYRAKTQTGFLNVHSDPKRGPFCLDTIVGQLVEGQVVTSVGEREGKWIKHDDGGWSVAEYNGVTWLEPIDD